MSFSRIYAIFIRQIFLIKGNPTRLSFIFVWVTLDIVMWGFLTKYLGSLGAATFSFVNVILGAIIFWELTSRLTQGTMTAFLEDIWSYNFINVFASPIKISEYLSGLVLTSITTSTSGFSAMILIAGLAFGYNIFKVGLLFVPFILILIIFGMAMGIFMSAAIFRLGPSAEWLGWPLPMVLSIFSGVFYPVTILPAFLQVIAKLIPASYAFESLRVILMTGTFSSQLAFNLFIGLGLALVYLLLTCIFFVRIYRYNLRSGAIARFSVEA